MIVLSRKLNDKLFGGVRTASAARSAGTTASSASSACCDHWEPQPKFYDLNNGNFAIPEDAYIPWKWGETLVAQLRRFQQLLEDRGHRVTPKASATPSASGFRCGSSCRTRPPATACSRCSTTTRIEQSEERPLPAPAVTTASPMSGPVARRTRSVVSSDNRVLVGLAFAFLAVCLINTIGLLLAKFLNAAPLSGVRRALGASRRDLFTAAHGRSGRDRRRRCRARLSGSARWDSRASARSTPRLSQPSPLAAAACAASCTWTSPAT